MLNLINLWNNITTAQNLNEVQISRQYSDDVKQTAINFDRDTTQSSFEFKNPPKVVFVKSIASLEPAKSYDQLPEITMTVEENNARLKCVDEQMAKDPRFYDGEQMVITGVIYDDSTNTIYMEAKKVPYSFILSLSKKKFPENSFLYQLTIFKTGVLAPLITRDSSSILLQRARDGLYSVPSGFLEAHGEEKRLNFSDGRNLVTETAITELKEEIAGINGTKELRFNFSNPKISSVSFRKTGANPIGTVEFVAPSYVNCNSRNLQKVFLTNSAKDAHEHASKHVFIPLKSRDRDVLLTTILTGGKILPGQALYLAVLVSLTRLENQDCCMMTVPQKIPNSYSAVYPLTIFKATPEKPLSICDEKPEDEESEDEVILSKKSCIS